MEGAVVSASMGVIGPLLAEITILCARLPAGRPKTEMQFFEEKLRSIQEMVSSLHAVKMSHMVEEDTLLKKRWAKQAREIAYDTQDLVDLFRHGAGLSLSDETSPAGVMPKTAGRLKKLRRFSSRPKKPRLDREMVNKVEELKARMAEVIERHKRFKIAMESSSPPKEDMPSCSGHQIQIQIQSEARSPAVSIDAYFSALYAGGDGLVGIDGPREELTALLMDENQHMKVISVLGPEGIGKTTLTKEVFNNIQGKFECCAFVSMSQKTGIQEILQAFLSQFSAQDQDGASIEACQEERLTHKLIQLLKSKRYFVMLDGVSSTRAWRLIRCALPGNNLGSRILMTTCIDDIVMSCCSTTADSIYRMKYLPEVERRRLFMDRTFGLEKRCPYRLEEVGSEILRKCGGWPIVILAIASLLASKSSSEEQWKMIQGSIGLALECPRKKKGLALEQSQVRSCDSLQGVKNILYFCYNDLPQHLKTCLLYLSIYPEGYVISRDRLVRRWIAEGFISVRSEHENLEEVGQCYFNELINRGMIQPVGIQYDGRADACQVHNLILSLIVSICAEENFVTLFDGQAHELGTTDKVRRLSLNYHGQKHFALPSTITASPIRSLTLFGSAQGAPILSNNRVLRVLDLDVQGDPGKKYLGTVGSFFQLKYLGLQMSGVVDLPEQIGELQFLETLDLTKSSIRKLPRSILRLWRLVYLLACNVELPDGVGDMQSLEALSGIQVNTTNSTNSLLGVGQLTKLRIVQLIWSISDVCGDIKGYEDNLLSSLKELSKLQSLSIESKDGSSLNFLDSWSPHPQSLQKLYLRGGYYFPRIPERIISLVNLDFLDIRVYQVEDEIMNVLGSLPALLVLSLSSQVAAPEQRIVVQPGLFHCLTKFTLTCLNSWTGLVTEPEALPKLARLGLLCYVQGQRDPVCGDYGIKYLCSLKNLHVEITLGGAGIWEVATRSPESPPPQVQISDEHHMVEEAEIIEVVESLSTHIEEESTIYKDAKMLPKPPTYDFKSWDPQHIVGVHVEMDSQSSQEGPEEVQGMRDVRRWENAIDVVRKANLQRDDPLNLAEKIVRNLENATEDLDAKGNDVRREIMDAERQQRTPTNKVNRWLQKVDNIIRDVQVISHDCRQLKKDVTILASEKLREVQECLSSCPSTVAIESMPPPVQEMPGPSMSAENRNLQDALHFIKDEPTVGMIGIWGPGGVGKTHLLRNINNSFGEGMDFDFVLFVTASRGCSVEKVQSQIIERLRLQSTGSKSHTIHEYMKTKSFLVLLDDLWDKIDLEDVGIPYPLGNVNKLNRKVVLTTRLRKVCGQMKVKKELKVAYLQEHEAWQLFEENIGAETLSSPHIEALAKELMKELKSLPLALVTIGKAMYRKDEYQWETAIQYMQQSCCADDKDPVELCMETNVFRQLKFSYDNLRNDTLRRCFLTCALWPEDENISKVDLAQCWMGLGLVNEHDIESSFRKSYSLIADLTAACLLEGCEYDDIGSYFRNSHGFVKVHDVIRDMALWISCDLGKNNGKWIVAAPGGRDKKVIILSNEAECISLMYNRIPIRFNPDPIKLRILCLRNNKLDESIIVEAIKNCISLTYLDLRENNLKRIPEELCSLVKLEYLDLSRNEFGETEVPHSFGKLINLKFLYLEFSSCVRIPVGVLCSLKALQVIDLRSYLCLPEWIFRELGTLPQLKALGIMVVGSAQFMSLLGEAANLPVRYLTLRGLGAFTRILSTDFAQRTLYELDIIDEDNTQQITVSYDTEQPNSHFGALNSLRLSSISLREIEWMGATPAFIFPRLTCLELFDCTSLLHLSWVMYLPRLERLYIVCCGGMVQAFMRCHGDKLCNGQDKTKTFPCLKLLCLLGNFSLETIGDNGMEFPSLERLVVLANPKLKSLPFQLDSLPKLKLKELRFSDAQDWERLECEEGVKSFLQPALKFGS